MIKVGAIEGGNILINVMGYFKFIIELDFL